MNELEVNEHEKHIKVLEDEIERANKALKEAEDKLDKLIHSVEPQKNTLEGTLIEEQKHEDVNESHHVRTSHMEMLSSLKCRTFVT